MESSSYRTPYIKCCYYSNTLLSKCPVKSGTRIRPTNDYKESEQWKLMLKDNQFLMVNSQIKVLRSPSRVRKEFKFSKTLHPSIHPLPCVSLEWLNHPNFPLFLSDKSPRHGPGTDQKDKHHRLDFIKNEKMCCSLKYRASKKYRCIFLTWVSMLV